MPKRRDIIPPKEIDRLIQGTRRGHVIEFESLNDLAARADGRVAVLHAAPHVTV